MSLNKGRHIFKELEGVRCTIVETQATEDRVSFLKELLELNGFEVVVSEEKRKTEEDPLTYTIGVTDITFHPVIAVYERKLKTANGRKVTPDYWNQLTDKTEPNYWDLSKKQAGQ